MSANNSNISKSINMKNQKLIQANEQMLQQQMKNGFKPEWYVVYHLNNGFNSRYQQQRRVNPDEVSKDIAFHKHTLYKFVYGNRRWAKLPTRARSLWSVEYGKSRERPHINMLIETLPSPFDREELLADFFNLTLPLRSKCTLFDSAHLQRIIPSSEIDLLRYICKETDQRNTSIDYYSTDWIL
jgi:hypothetical protein